MKLLLATRNLHKAREIATILGCEVASLRDLPQAPEIDENAGSFAGNATTKAVQTASWLQAQDWGKKRSAPHPRPLSPWPDFVMADDSGLEVDALGGKPGVLSARFAQEQFSQRPPDEANNTRLLALLKGVPPDKRTARFRCVLALTPVIERGQELASPVCLASELELMTRLFEGFCEGTIGLAPRGNGGFGYDPLFIPNGYERTLAELGPEIKNKISHRGKALAKLKRYLQRENSPKQCRGLNS